MKRLMRLTIVAMILGLSIAVGVSYDPGNVRIKYGQYLYESNLWVLLFFVVLAGVSVWCMIKIFTGTFHSGKALTGWFGKSAKTRAQNKTEQGLIALLEGNWHSAAKLLNKSATKAHKPLINYLAAAHSANELGNVKEAERLLKLAYDSDQSSEFAVGIAQAQIQLQQGQLESSLATLLRLNKQQAHHPYVLKLLNSVYLKLEDWSQLLKLSPELLKYTNLPEQKVKAIEKQAWTRQFIQKTEELINRNQKDSADEILADLWRSVPDPLRYDKDLVETYALQLTRIDQQAECETLLRKVLKRHWSDNLVRLYGMVKGDNASEQLIHAENWLKERPNNPALLLALGRLSLQNQLWGKALEYFEASLKLQDSSETLAELCRLKLKTSKSLDETRPDINALLGKLSLPALPLPGAAGTTSDQGS